MPNQLNYPKKLASTRYQRPERLDEKDLKLMGRGQTQVLFGTSNRDMIEIWIYNPDGTFAGNLNVGPADTALSLTTVVDTTGAHELLNIDMKSVVNRIDLQPGRYAMVANFFRREIGSNDGYKLYISEISEDRTELRLQPTELTANSLKDLFDFASPAVPKVFANGMIDQIFGKSLDVTEPEMIDVPKLETELGVSIKNRIAYADPLGAFHSKFQQMLNASYALTIQYMAEDVFNLNVQQIEIEQYISKALDDVIYGMVQRGEFDPRFMIV